MSITAVSLCMSASIVTLEGEATYTTGTAPPAPGVRCITSQSDAWTTSDVFRTALPGEDDRALHGGASSGRDLWHGCSIGRRGQKEWQECNNSLSIAGDIPGSGMIYSIRAWESYGGAQDFWVSGCQDREVDGRSGIFYLVLSLSLPDGQ